MEKEKEKEKEGGRGRERKKEREYGQWNLCDGDVPRVNAYLIDNV